MVFPEAPTEYDLGDAPILTGEFRASDTGVLTDPTTVQVQVMPPSGITVIYTQSSTPAVTSTATGVWTLQLPVVTQVGDWFYRFVGSGALVDAVDARFSVRASVFAAAVAPTAKQWVSGQSLVGEPRLDDANMPPGVTFDMCAEASTDYLHSRSGQRYRMTDVELHPNAAGFIASCGCVSATMRELELPSPVVDGTVVVVIDGVTLPTTAYAVYGAHKLVRIDGGWWPTCRHLLSGSDWSIFLTYGQPPPMSGVLACRELAIHVALALSGKISKIPARATTITLHSGRGLAINLARGARTGIALVDDFLDAVNPNRLTGRGSVVSPDTIRLDRAEPTPGVPPDYVLYGGDSST